MDSRGSRPFRMLTDDAPVTLPPAVERTLAAFLAERFPKAKGPRLRAEIERLSEAFAADREELPGSYLNRPESRSAYLAFFHPQQVLRAMAALAEVRVRAEARGLLPKRDLVRVLDLGAGLGAMSQAALAVDAFPAAAYQFTLVDHQRSALTDGREILLRTAAALRGADAPGPLVRTADERIEAWLRKAADAGWRYDVILLGGVWNELHGAWEPVFERILGLLDPAAPGGGIVVSMEPALPEYARRLQGLRDTFLGRTTTIAPCTHQRACPLLKLSRDWCFTTRSALFSVFVREEAAHLRHQAHEVRYAVWAAAGRRDAAPPELPEALHARVISDKVSGGQVLCVLGEKERMPESAPGLRRGALLAADEPFSGPAGPRR